MSQADSFDGLEGPGEGVSELESDCEVVSSLASGLYAELERLIRAHGQEAAAGLVPLAVATLESLQGACAESRTTRAEAERERQENRSLLAQYERERAERKRIEEKCLELEDLMENDRKTQKSRLELAAAENRQMEVKARNYADMLFQLEEEKVTLEKEHNKLLQTYNVVLRNLKDLQSVHKTQPEERRYSGSSTPLPKRFQEQSQLTGDGTDVPTNLTQEEGRGQADSDLQADVGSIAAVSGSPTTEMERPVPLVDPVTQEVGEEAPVSHTASDHRGQRDCEIERILETTPELLDFPEVKQIPKASTPGHSEDEGVDRNTDSILQELQNLGSGFIEELDEGLDLLDHGSQLENLATENAELREKHAAADCARRNLICRVEELVRERTDLKQELEQNQLLRTEVEKKLAASQRATHSPQLGASERRRDNAEDDEVSSRQSRSFTRAEMSRVLTERNLYKERLMELQEAVRRMDTVRALRDHQNHQAKRSSVWERFYQLLGRSSVPQDPVLLPLVASIPRRGSNWSLTWDERNSSEGLSRDQQSELYSQIRRHIWRELGKAQIQGWSHPPKEALGEMGSGGLFAAPALVQVRLLDQKDPSTKLCCATGVQISEGTLPRSGSVEATAKGSTGTLWICSATHSETEVMVVDATRASHILDHFTLTNCRILCAASVPASTGKDGEEGSSGRSVPGSRAPLPNGRAESTHIHKSSEPTVWLGSQSGSIFVHVGRCCRRRYLHLLQLVDSVHSIEYSGGFVAACLGNGTHSIFHRDPDGTWDLNGHRCVDLGLPLQPVSCAVPVHDKLWCGYRNRVYIINPHGPKTEKWFEVVSQAERQVRHLACLGDGVWVSVRFESVLRLFHSLTGQPLQEVDILPFVIGQFGSGPPALSFLQVTAMSVICKRLWIGTGTGFIVSVPLSSELAAGSIPMIANGAPAGQEDPLQAVTATPSPSIPYCVMSLAQICFHGHRDAVRFFVSVSVSSSSVIPGVGSPADSTPVPSEDGLSELIVSGGEGYINFRIGVDSEVGDRSSVRLKSERSHLIVSRMRR